MVPYGTFAHVCKADAYEYRLAGPLHGRAGDSESKFNVFCVPLPKEIGQIWHQNGSSIGDRLAFRRTAGRFQIPPYSERCVVDFGRFSGSVGRAFSGAWLMSAVRGKSLHLGWSTSDLPDDDCSGLTHGTGGIGAPRTRYAHGVSFGRIGG